MDPRELRDLMSRWVTGVAVVTSTDGAGPRGATTNALTSLSLDPLLVLVALDHGSSTLEAVRGSGVRSNERFASYSSSPFRAIPEFLPDRR